jgi:hypothetical protein
MFIGSIFEILEVKGKMEQQILKGSYLLPGLSEDGKVGALGALGDLSNLIVRIFVTQPSPISPSPHP